MDTEQKPPIDRRFSMGEFFTFCFAVTLSVAMLRTVHDAEIPFPAWLIAVEIVSCILLTGALGAGSFTLLFGRRRAVLGGLLVTLTATVLLVLRSLWVAIYVIRGSS